MTAQNSMQGGNFAFGPISAGFSAGGGTDLDASVKLLGAQSSFWKKNTRWLNENGWQMMRQGLINGDYNPLLAVSREPLSGALPTGSATDGTIGFNGGYDASAGYNASTARMNANADIQNKNAQTELIKNQTENLGNSPFNALGNFVKGLLGFQNDSSTRAFTAIGQSARKYGINKLLSLSNKINKYNASSSHMFDIGISNTNDGWIKGINRTFHYSNTAKPTLNGVDLTLTPEEQKIINDVTRNAIRNKGYNRPPKSFPQ